jgi:hypothetical protein
MKVRLIESPIEDPRGPSDTALQHDVPAVVHMIRRLPRTNPFSYEELRRHLQINFKNYNNSLVSVRFGDCRLVFGDVKR